MANRHVKPACPRLQKPATKEKVIFLGLAVAGPCCTFGLLDYVWEGQICFSGYGNHSLGYSCERAWAFFQTIPLFLSQSCNSWSKKFPVHACKQDISSADLNAAEEDYYKAICMAIKCDCCRIKHRRLRVGVLGTCIAPGYIHTEAHHGTSCSIGIRMTDRWLILRFYIQWGGLLSFNSTDKIYI